MNVGIVGAGGVSLFHYQGYTAAGATIVAIAYANPLALAARQKEWGIPKGYGTWEELVADPTIEAISVCLPNALHHPVTLAAARAGKHVLCEKPLSLSLEKAQEMIDVCREAGVVLQTGHHLRSDNASLQTKKLIDSGALGRVTFMRLRQAHDWGGAKTVRGVFGSLAHSGGGTLLDNGCHMMDLARYFGGDVRQIYANTATLGFDVEVEDTSVATLTFASGTLGSVENAWTATGWEQAFWIYGTEGSLEYSNRTNVLTHRFRSSAGTTFGEPDIAHTTFGGYEAHTACEIDFLAAVRGERDVVCTGEDGLEAVRLVLAGYESARENAPVRLASEQVPETLPSA